MLLLSLFQIDNCLTLHLLPKWNINKRIHKEKIDINNLGTPQVKIAETPYPLRYIPLDV